MRVLPALKLREWNQAVLALTPCRGRREDFGVRADAPSWGRTLALVGM